MFPEMWVPSCNGFKDSQVTNLIALYGGRAITLARLAAISHEYGFCVPSFGVIPVSYAGQINALYGDKNNVIETPHFLSQNPVRLEFCRKIILQNLVELIECAKVIDSAGKPIIRGSSSMEGCRNLSFAGVCHSAIPKQIYSIAENIIQGVPGVIAGSFSNYANYYFSHHDMPSAGRNAALIFMEMINNPVIHAAAYVWSDGVGIRYFLNPIIGSSYSGGYEMNIDFSRDIAIQLKPEARLLKNEWMKVVELFRELFKRTYEKPTPLDIEFLVSGTPGNYQIQIVQVRPISETHLMNYHASTDRVLTMSDENVFLVPRSHLYHSVGRVCGNIVKLNQYVDELTVQDAIDNYHNPIFVIPHCLGVGTFAFLRSLPVSCSKRMSVLITHPNCRTSDHLQYSVYEDRRLKMVVHCSDELDDWIDNGCAVEICSTGKQVIINKKE